MGQHVAGTTPYPWPFDGDLDPTGTALLVLSAPTPGGPPADVAAATARLARAVRRSGGTVIAAIAQQPPRRGRPSPPGGAAPSDGLVPAGVEPDEIVRAGGLDAFHGSDLDLVLRTRGIARLLLAGDGLETAVHSTMRDANDRGYECLLVIDACAAVDERLVPAAVSMVEMSGGIFGAVGRTVDVVAALSPAAAVRHQHLDPDDPASTRATTVEGDPT